MSDTIHARSLSRGVLGTLLATLPAFAALPGASAAPVIVGANYQDTKSNPNCNIANCSLSFTPVPAGRNLTITHFTCFIEALNVAQTPELSLLDNTFAHYFNGLPQFLYNQTIGSTVLRAFASNDEVFQIVKGGKFPAATAITPAAAGKIRHFACTISGQLR